MLYPIGKIRPIHSEINIQRISALFSYLYVTMTVKIRLYVCSFSQTKSNTLIIPSSSSEVEFNIDANLDHHYTHELVNPVNVPSNHVIFVTYEYTIPNQLQYQQTKINCCDIIFENQIVHPYCFKIYDKNGPVFFFFEQPKFIDSNTLSFDCSVPVIEEPVIEITAPNVKTTLLQTGSIHPVSSQTILLHSQNGTPLSSHQLTQTFSPGDIIYFIEGSTYSAIGTVANPVFIEEVVYSSLHLYAIYDSEWTWTDSEWLVEIRNDQNQSISESDLQSKINVSDELYVQLDNNYIYIGRVQQINPSSTHSNRILLHLLPSEFTTSTLNGYVSDILTNIEIFIQSNTTKLQLTYPIHKEIPNTTEIYLKMEDCSPHHINNLHNLVKTPFRTGFYHFIGMQNITLHDENDTIPTSQKISNTFSPSDKIYFRNGSSSFYSEIGVVADPVFENTSTYDSIHFHANVDVESTTNENEWIIEIYDESNQDITESELNNKINISDELYVKIENNFVYFGSVLQINPPELGNSNKNRILVYMIESEITYSGTMSDIITYREIFVKLTTPKLKLTEPLNIDISLETEIYVQSQSPSTNTTNTSFSDCVSCENFNNSHNDFTNGRIIIIGDYKNYGSMIRASKLSELIINSLQDDENLEAKYDENNISSVIITDRHYGERTNTDAFNCSMGFTQTTVEISGTINISPKNTYVSLNYI